MTIYNLQLTIANLESTIKKLVQNRCIDDTEIALRQGNGDNYEHYSITESQRLSWLILISGGINPFTSTVPRATILFIAHCVTLLFVLLRWGLAREETLSRQKPWRLVPISCILTSFQVPQRPPVKYPLFSLSGHGWGLSISLTAIYVVPLFLIGQYPQLLCQYPQLLYMLFFYF